MKFKYSVNDVFFNGFNMFKLIGYVSLQKGNARHSAYVVEVYGNSQERKKILPEIKFDNMRQI